MVADIGVNRLGGSAVKTISQEAPTQSSVPRSYSSPTVAPASFSPTTPRVLPALPLAPAAPVGSSTRQEDDAGTPGAETATCADQLAPSLSLRSTLMLVRLVVLRGLLKYLPRIQSA